jgi:hypothetical protein
VGNVTFISGEAHEVLLDSDFDAVAGRWALMYQPDPAAALRHLVGQVRPGGIIAFQENDFTYPPIVFPPSDLSRQLQHWTIPPPGTPGPEMQIDISTGTQSRQLVRRSARLGLLPVAQAAEPDRDPA